MQKLSVRQQNTPRGAPQAPGTVNRGLNREETLSACGRLRADNSSDVDQQSGRTGRDLRVPVINMRGEALMPTTPAKARHLLKDGKAEVVKRKPFTIRLNYPTGETKQPIRLGFKPSYAHVGFSAITEKNEMLAGELELRTDIPGLLVGRKRYRRGRRDRKGYREPRFDNRSREEGWLAPSIQHKLDTIIKLSREIRELLPVTSIAVAVAAFDIQKIKNPEIAGEEYQKGEQKGFWNTREYVLHRDNHKCQHCRGKKKDKVLEVHHINGRNEGATDRPEELLTVCKTCHENHHRGKDTIPRKEIRRFKPETFMTTVRWRLVDRLKELYGEDNVSHTYGYITKSRRIELGLEKSHVNDAFVIAGGNGQERCMPHSIRQVRRNNRSLQTNRKGFRPSIRRQRYELQRQDLVRYKGKEHRVRGVHCYGSRVVLDNGKSVAMSKVELVKYGKGLCYV